MGGAAPGEPGDGGLAKAKPEVLTGQGDEVELEERWLGEAAPPRQHIDDRAKYDDGKDNKTRPIGT